MIQTRDCLGEFGEYDYTTVEYKVIWNIDWNGFKNDFMKEIHIIEIQQTSIRMYPKKMWVGLGCNIFFWTFKNMFVDKI